MHTVLSAVYFQAGLMWFVQVIITHKALLTEETEGPDVVADAVVETAVAACAEGVIAPLTLQGENLIKCDTED